MKKICNSNKVVKKIDSIAKISFVFATFYIFLLGIFDILLFRLFLPPLISNILEIFLVLSSIWVLMFWGNCLNEKTKKSKLMKNINISSRIIVGLMTISSLSFILFDFSIIEFFLGWSQYLVKTFYIFSVFNGIWLAWNWIYEKF